jgi:capsular polysaccharide biosynthesis protein
MLQLCLKHTKRGLALEDTKSQLLSKVNLNSQRISQMFHFKSCYSECQTAANAAAAAAAAASAINILTPDNATAKT